MLTEEFQSAPGREAGRYPKSPIIITAELVFQSAPGREAGRYESFSSSLAATPWFQSAPGREAGRYARGGRIAWCQHVSIRARP